jgi:aryl-alcohol dehydrogenase-like predicted oxidoreductase
MYQHRYWQDVQLRKVAELAEAARKRDLELASVAVAWVLRQPGVTSAIIGASRPEQLDATVTGGTLELDDELAAQCDAVWFDLPRRPVADGYR